MKPKLLIGIGHWGKPMSDCFRLSDKWYVRQMKLFKFMNCRTSWTPDKLRGSLPPPPKKDPSAALGTPRVTLKISRKWWMNSEQRISLRISTIRGKLFPYYKYIRLEHDK